MKLFKFSKIRLHLAAKILIGMLLGIAAGFAVKLLPPSTLINTYVIDGICDIIGQWFIAALKMLIVPIVFVSLVCSTCHFSDTKALGKISVKTLGLFILSITIAVLIGLGLALFFNVGANVNVTLPAQTATPAAISMKQMLISLVTSNPIHTMAEGNLLQLIIFSLFFGVVIGLIGPAGKPIVQLFDATNKALLKFIDLVIKTAPYGVFCLMTVAVTKMGMALLDDLLWYCLAIAIALIIQYFGIYSLMLIILGRLNPLPFFRKTWPAMLLGFSTSSSSATIPLLLEICPQKLGVNNLISSFVVPLGTTIHKSGCAIMQSVAVIFIANIYHIPLVSSTYVLIIFTTVLTALSTSGMPSAGIFTLTMILQQVGLPVEGIGLLIGIDRFIDMLRTPVSVAGVGVTACIVAKSEKTLNTAIYNSAETDI